MFGSHRLRAAAALGGILLLQACSAESPTPAVLSGPSLNTGGDGAVLSVRKTGEGYWSRRTTYDWSVAKSVTPASAELQTGASATFSYTVTATRSDPIISAAVYGMRGQVCVTNIGDAPTVNLAVSDQLLADGYILVFEGVIDVSNNPVLDPGETGCYAYDFVLPSAPDLRYTHTNKARAVTTRANGSLLDAYGNIAISWPTTPSETVEDAGASLVDVLTCPSGFTCTPTGGSWDVTDTNIRNYDVVITNVSAPCNTTHQAPNTVTLTESTSGVQHQANANVTLTTPACVPLGGGETATGYGTKWPNTSNWFMYSPYSTSKTDLVTGSKLKDIGDIYMSRSGSTTTIQITLVSGWTWDAVAEVIKIHPMDRAPTDYIQPGAFMYKFTAPNLAKTPGTTVNVVGQTATITMPGTSARFYGIHVDVRAP